MPSPDRPDPDFGERQDPSASRQLGLWSNWGHLKLLLWAGLLLSGDILVQWLTLGVVDDFFLPVAVGGLLAVVLPCHVLSRSFGGTLATEFHLGSVPLAKLVWAALAAVAVWMPASVLADLSTRITPIPDAWIDMLTEHLPDRPLDIVTAAVAAVIIAPLAEELLFRGIIYRLARRVWGPSAATLLSALVFALLHWEPWFIFGLFGLGVLLAYIYEMTGSLTPCFVTHAAYNAISFVLLLQGEEPAVETVIRPDLELALLAASVVLLVFVCVRLARDDG